ncbi:CaiF/GrlA family transcriptional regulator [Providencia rettgeri]
MSTLEFMKKENKIMIKAKQVNHSAFFIPKELQNYEEKYLYKYIARWSLIHKKYICCNDVAENFGISVRQATNIISLIHRRYADKIHHKAKKLKCAKSKAVKTYILVKEIRD